eukprot:TRINITY_DN40575_c0_g1_i1.p1 TRINITY_DN40575_c0_g1~~TRINITY_DN40575_c0_g1_i1.p1  ORF type:complete len:138 (+),score=11.75 TRINITY_DN40575_c0_g1_i1:102-515(+)
MHSCPAGCCNVCDLRCSGRDCHIMLDFLKDPSGDFGCAIGDAWDVDWRSTVLGRPVHWEFKLTGPPLRQIKRSVMLTDTSTGWKTDAAGEGNVPDDEAVRQWDRITRQCLADYGRRFTANSSSAFHREELLHSAHVV